tara:strand:- start:761 stop:943 length:183 start_codon:yes stop_codon:yes gene_type:complete
MTVRKRLRTKAQADEIRRKIIEGLAANKTQKVIAAEIGLSQSLVSYYATQIKGIVPHGTV